MAMSPYDPAIVPDSIHALQLSARSDPHDCMVLADWYESRDQLVLADATRLLHGLYRPDAAAMAAIMFARPEVARLWRDELPESPHRTRKRVDKMTTGERGRMPEWAEKWTKIGLSTERADRPLFEAAVAACYRYSGLSDPRAVIWAPCPIVAICAGSIATAVLRRLGQSGDSAAASVEASVRDSVRDSVHAGVHAAVHAAVCASSVGAGVDDGVGVSVGDAVARASRLSLETVGASVIDSGGDSVSTDVDNSVLCSVRSSVLTSVCTSVHDSVGSNVDTSVDDSVDDSVGVSVTAPAQVASQDLEQWHLYNGGQFRVGGYWWGPAAVSFALDVLRLDIGREQEAQGSRVRCDVYVGVLVVAAPGLGDRLGAADPDR